MQGEIQQLSITKEDEELVAAAKEIIKKLYKPNFHAVGSAIRTKAGKIYTAVHLETFIGRTAVCAEAIVLGKAISEGEKEFDTIVAAYHSNDGNINVCSPCGMCRELLSDYNKEMKIIMLEDDKLYKCNVLDLLPKKYFRS